ncbi:Carboxypeptidase B [Operophtera brumata]|uniref:Carboxypeptidase B n=1 Tax=Operophtera brumata TaxID=104452 RepID=A0A0L7L1Y4_OPEBR|nr:Carboxypeptidase B [Operophtera brumata]
MARLLSEARKKIPKSQYLIPMGNPDGLHFSQSLQLKQPVETKEWSTNLTIRKYTRPMEWNKNVDKESQEDTCFGTHINRNFAYHWQGRLVDASSAWSAGPHEFILYPWRYSLRQPTNSKALQEIGEYAARQARLPDGRLYAVRTDY